MPINFDNPDQNSPVIIHPARLLPELERCLFQDPRFGMMIRNPYCHVTHYTSKMNAHYNESFIQLSERAADHAKRGQWSDYFGLIARPYRLQILLGHLHDNRITDARWFRLVGQLWSDAENPSYLSYWDKRKLFFSRNQKARPLIMSVQARRLLQGMPEMITVYRGCQKRRHLKRWSWTTDRAVAEFLATRFSGEGLICEGTCTKEDVIALIIQRNESEVIIDPKHVENFTVQAFELPFELVA